MSVDGAGTEMELGIEFRSTNGRACYGDLPVKDAGQAKDYFCLEDGQRFAGKHILIDLKGAKRLNDIDFIEQTLRQCVEVSGATLLHIHLHHFTPYGGVSGVAVLAESHISIHSWPEENFAAFDIFMCGNTQPEKAVDVLRAAFLPEQIEVQTVKRGRVDVSG